MNAIIAPSILAADFSNLQTEIEMLNDSEADYIHVDVMDGLFVPNISFGFPVLEAIHKHAEKPLDVHLMIVDPDRYIKRFQMAGADNISVHFEACIHLHKTIQDIRALGCTAGVALNPHTAVSVLEEIITEVDIVCIMSVNPGFGGQAFIENTINKVKKLKELILKSGAKTQIEIDGGVSLVNAGQLLEAGADILVAGNFVFSADNPRDMIINLKNRS